HYDQSDEVDCRVRIGQSPRPGGQRPKEKFEIRTRKTDPQPFRLLRKQPGVTHVDIKGRGEINQQESEFMHLAAKVFASQAVPEFMPDHDEDHNRQNYRKSPPLPEARQILQDVPPVSVGDPNGAENSQRGQDHKSRRKAELDLADQIIEQPVWIEGPESQIERVTLDKRCGLFDLLLAAVQQARW